MLYVSYISIKLREKNKFTPLRDLVPQEFRKGQLDQKNIAQAQKEEDRTRSRLTGGQKPGSSKEALQERYLESLQHSSPWSWLYTQNV